MKKCSLIAKADIKNDGMCTSNISIPSSGCVCIASCCMFLFLVLIFWWLHHCMGGIVVGLPATAYLCYSRCTFNGAIVPLWGGYLCHSWVFIFKVFIIISYIIKYNIWKIIPCFGSIYNSTHIILLHIFFMNIYWGEILFVNN